MLTDNSQLENQEKKIIALMLEHLKPYPDNDHFMVNSSLIIRLFYKEYKIFPSLRDIQKQDTSVAESTYHNLLARNQESSLIQELFDEQWQSCIVSDAESQAFCENYDYRWSIHYCFSRVGFSADSQQALIYVTMHCPAGPPQCGTVYFFTWAQNNWQYKNSFGVYNQ
jgi:hypothetical protein